VKRRDFITLLCGAPAWPLAVRAQQLALPVVGFLYASSRETVANQLVIFRRVLAEAGYIEGKNVAIDYRFADGQYDRLPTLAGELVGRPVSVIITAGAPAAQTAKAATSTVPIVFVAGFDPVKSGLVESLNRPGGNATGIAFMATQLGPKRLELVRDLLPKATVVAMLANPTTPDAVQEIGAVQATAPAIGLQLKMLNATNLNEIESGVASLAGPDAVMVGVDPLFYSQRNEVVAIVRRSGLPAIYPFREYSKTGGLMSYGASIPDAVRQAGIYVGRILRGEKPADLPVMQPTKFELIFNLKTAKALGLDVPPTLLARADEVIE
jgi:putative tryptophan/tyrosine transport system substrate-binding protein